MFEKGSKPFQEILSTAEHAASRAAHSAKGICQAKLQAHVIPCRRHSSKKVPAVSHTSFRRLPYGSEACGTAGYLAPGAQPRGSAPAPSHYSPYPCSPWRKDNTILHSSGKGIQYIHGFLIMSALNKIGCCPSADTLFILVSALTLLAAKSSETAISPVSARGAAGTSVLPLFHDLLVRLLDFLKFLLCLILIGIVDICIRMVLPA